MPRRSRESRDATDNVVSLTPGAGRPEPPPELDDDERLAWQQIVGAMPAHWFKAEALALLQGLVGHIVTSRELERRLRQDRKTLSLKDLRLLTMLVARETAAIERLSGALRLSPKSQYAPRTAANRGGGNNAKRTRPWEIRGGSED